MELIDLSPDAGHLELSAVERGADGLPTAWPLLREGDNHLTIRGRPANLKLSGGDIDAIVSYHAAKGAKIPLDSRHVLSNLALKLNIDEGDILRRLPRLSGTAGFGRLEHRDGALMLSDVEWLPIAAGVMREGMIRYFSPTIQGLDGRSPLRVTSVSLDNEPCLQNIASLACSEAAEEINVATPDELRELLKNKGGDMPDDLTKAADAADKNEPPARNEADGELLKLLKEVLGDDVTPETLKGTLAALKANSDELPELKKQIQAHECAEAARKEADEAARLESAHRRGLAESLITAAELDTPFFKSLNAAQFSAFLDTRVPGCAAPVGMLQLSEHRTEPPKPSTPSHDSNSVRAAISAAPTTNME